MSYRNGFTLIELLVVIAIIGFLATIALVNLNTARINAKNAQIKSIMNNWRTQATLYYDDIGAYELSPDPGLGICDTPHFHGYKDNYTTYLSAVLVSGLSGACSENAEEYAVLVYLVPGSGSLLYWCMDSTGVAKETNLPLHGEYVSDPDPGGVQFQCP